jgi:uncharacterized protein DUF3617
MRPILPFFILFLITGQAVADPLPQRKAGLWQLTMSMPGKPMPPTISKFCIDAATESALMGVGLSASKEMCSQYNVQASGNVVTIDTTCKFGQSTQTAHAVTTYSGDSSYRTEILSHYAPPLFKDTDNEMILEGKWLGACPADMKPGEMIGPGGLKMDLGGALKPTTNQPPQ